MKASVCFVFAVVCWIAAQAEESPKILTLSKVMNELNKINKGMVKGTPLNSPTINDLKFQGGRNLAGYVQEFINSCCDDLTLMECFRCGLDPCWTLEKYINFALWVDGELTAAVMNEPETEKWTEPRISPEHELHCESEQVCEPVLTSVVVVVLVELNADDRLIDWEKEVVLPNLPATIVSSLQHCSYPSSSSSDPVLPPPLDFYGSLICILGGGACFKKYAVLWFHFHCIQFLFCVSYAQYTLYDIGLSQMNNDQCETITGTFFAVAPKQWSCYVTL